MVYKAIIVGGGASGLCAAICLLRGQNALKGEDVLIIEKCDRVGKKLISTGNGQGNVCNQNLSNSHYHGNREFINQLFPNFSLNQITSFLSDVGVSLTTDGTGRMYPLSRQASAVLDLFRAHILSSGVKTLCSTTVQDVKRVNSLYEVTTNDLIFKAERVIFAFGGSAGKQFGTDGSSYHLVQKFGHKKTQLYPSLVQLKTQTQDIKGLKGIKEVARVSAYQNDQLLATEVGDLLFTEYGVSGDSIFRLSSRVVDKSKVILKIEFLPDYTLEQTEVLLEHLRATCPIYNENAFVGLLNKKVGNMLCKKANDLNPKTLAQIAKNFTLEVTGNLGFNYAQVTKGGIDAKDVNAKTFESKLTKGLYVLGEALDVDGDCGGYNLAFAFHSAIQCAKHIKEQNKGE